MNTALLPRAGKQPLDTLSVCSLVSSAPRGLLHLSFSWFFCIFIFPFGRISWLGGAGAVNANLAGLAFSSLLCGHTAREGEFCFSAFLLSPRLIPPWKASLWNFSAFCLCYRTSGRLSKQGCPPFAFPGAHIPVWVWTARLWLATTFPTPSISQSHGKARKGPREIVQSTPPV